MNDKRIPAMEDEDWLADPAERSPASSVGLWDALEEERELRRAAHEQLKRFAAEANEREKRVAREHAEQLRFANQGILTDLLGVLDNLETCFIGASDEPGALREGLRATIEQFHTTMRGVGVESLTPAVGAPFDPALHEAVVLDRSSSLPPRSITRVLQPGFLYHDRLLRPVRVAVASR